MEGNNLDVLGPVDYLVVEFPSDKANFSGEMAAELKSLVDRELVRVLDLVIMNKDLDGAVAVDELHEVDESHLGQLRALETDLAMLLAEEDLEEIGKVLEPGNVAAVLVDENSWAAPFASSVRRRRRHAGRRRPHPHPGTAGRHRSGRRNRQGRSLTCQSAQDVEAGPEHSAADRSREPPRSSARRLS